MSELLAIETAQQRILAALRPIGSEPCRVEDCAGRVLAEDITSPLALPPFDNSSMDGFCLRAADIAAASAAAPVVLPVSADIPAGAELPAPLPAGSAARILTGAPLPPGADAVLPVENTDQYGKAGQTLPQTVACLAPVKTGENVRRKGEDLQQGQRVLKKGRTLQAQDVGLLVALGFAQVAVMRRPRIAVFSSGDELLTPGQPLAPGKIYDANRYVLGALLQDAGAEVLQMGIARDTRASVEALLQNAAAQAPDLILSSAGVSVGVYDFVRQVLEENGVLDFWRVNMRPGKPVAFGQYQGIPFLGLPGNPVSAYIGCLVFVLPLLRALLGQPAAAPRTVQATLTEALESPDGRESFYRGILSRSGEQTLARLAGHQGSGNLFSLVQANALLIVPAGVKTIAAGESVTAWPLDEESA